MKEIHIGIEITDTQDDSMHVQTFAFDTNKTSKEIEAFIKQSIIPLLIMYNYDISVEKALNLAAGSFLGKSLKDITNGKLVLSKLLITDEEEAIDEMKEEAKGEEADQKEMVRLIERMRKSMEKGKSPKTEEDFDLMTEALEFFKKMNNK